MKRRMLLAMVLVGLAGFQTACDDEKVADSGSKEKVVAVPPAPEASSMTMTPAPAPAPAPGFIDPAPMPAPAPKANATKAPAPKASTGAAATAGHKTYVVQKGDNLTKISKKFYGDENHVKAIAAANNITDPNKIKAGQTIIIP